MALFFYKLYWVMQKVLDALKSVKSSGDIHKLFQETKQLIFLDFISPLTTDMGSDRPVQFASFLPS